MISYKILLPAALLFLSLPACAQTLVLPNHHHLCITVFVSDSRSSEEVREHLIAAIARMAYDAYNQPQSAQDPGRVAANKPTLKNIGPDKWLRIGQPQKNFGLQ